MVSVLQVPFMFRLVDRNVWKIQTRQQQNNLMTKFEDRKITFFYQGRAGKLDLLRVINTLHTKHKV